MGLVEVACCEGSRRRCQGTTWRWTVEGPSETEIGVDNTCMVMLGGHGRFPRNRTENGFVRNYVHLLSDYLTAFREAGLNVIQCIEPLWGDKEIATLEFADEMPDLMEAAFKGVPIVIVWELEKSV